jgi:hypothetical protein
VERGGQKRFCPPRSTLHAPPFTVPPNPIGRARGANSEKAGKDEKQAIAQLATSATAYQRDRFRRDAGKTVIYGLILLTGAFPLALAWRASRRSTLRHALAWAWAAWLAWVTALSLSDLRPGNHAGAARYIALCLTGCAGVAVLGARRPGVTAWNFVILAQLAVLLLPLAEGWGDLHLEPLPLVFLSATLAVGFLNYLPTRLAAAIVSSAIGCGVEIALLRSAGDDVSALERAALFSRCLLAASPWFAWLQVRTTALPLSVFDHLWLGFRDRYGLVWAQRVREQFNRAATHAGWPVVLRWRGLRLVDPTAQVDERMRDDMVTALRALLKRFGPTS